MHSMTVFDTPRIDDKSYRPKNAVTGMADMYDKLTRFEEYYHYLESSFIDTARIIPLENKPTRSRRACTKYYRARAARSTES